MSLQIEMPQLSSDGESATLASWLVEVGDKVEEGDVIAELETDKSTVELEAPGSGTILELAIPAGTEDVAPGTVLGRIDPALVETHASPTVAAVDDRIDASASAVAPDQAGPASPASAEDVSEATPASAEDVSEASPASAPDVSEASPAPIEDVSQASVVSIGDARAAAAPAPEDRAEGQRRPTPLARRVAEQSGVDLKEVSGSGPRGRVVEADVLRLASDRPSSAETRERVPSIGARPAPGIAKQPEARTNREEAEIGEASGVEVVPLSAMRKTIARRLTESKQQVPHFYLRARVAMDDVIAARARLNEALAEEGREDKLSLNDFVVRAAALALREVPEANVQFAGDAMHHFARVDVSVAVATEGGLVTPVVRDADRKGLVSLSAEIRALAAQARAGSLRPEQYQGGTFTVSNLGMYGIETVYPILNPPQACILGVGAAEEQPVVRAGELGVGRIAALTLAADHRAVDGAVGARLLAAVRARLEDPMGMVL